MKWTKAHSRLREAIEEAVIEAYEAGVDPDEIRKDVDYLLKELAEDR